MSKVYYTGKKLFDGHKCIDDFALLEENGKIVAVGKQTEIPCPEDAERQALEGVVTPGILDCHVHLVGSDMAENEQISPRETARLVCKGVRNANMLLSAGVVACRDLGSIYGYSLGIRDAIDQGIVPGPKVLTTGLSISVTAGHGGNIALQCDSPDEMRKGVRTIIRNGADVVKLMASGGVNSPGPEPGPCELTEAEFAAGVEAAHDMGRKVAIHAHGNTAIRRGVWAGVDSVEHGVFMTEDIMDEMVRRGTYIVPTLSAPYYAVEEGLRVDPDNPDHLRSKSVIQRHRDMLKKCSEKGVKIAFGTDAGNTYDPYEKAYFELVLMVEAGLTPVQAFTAATVGSADLMGLSDCLGTLETGKNASFICWKAGDPLENIQSVTGEKTVYLDGKVVSALR
mgnify:FL=1